FVQIPEPVARVLRDQTTSSVNSAGIDRAVERAVKAHATADSTSRAGTPATAVPMPNGAEPGSTAAPAQPAQPAQPANPTPKKP
ncbi:MAG TPA: hypothetical protein VLI40_06280, partial [Gemmatimonadaceae bacterium]|nr:hypothetical protein [Gemmatimonadaceae bacterium]